MNNFVNAMRAHALDMASSYAQPRWGVVTAVDPVNYLVRVEMQPEGVQTGWLPVTSQAVGAGWGMSMLPTAGQQVLIIPELGDGDNYVVVGGGYSTQNMPAQVPAIPGAESTPAQPGEMLLTHQSGSYLRLNADGSVMLNAAGALHATVVGAATIASEVSVTISAPVIGLDAPAVTGQQSGATAQRLATESFVLSTFASHTHSGVEAGAGNTGVPNQGAAAADLTTNFKGS